MFGEDEGVKWYERKMGKQHRKKAKIKNENNGQKIIVSLPL